MLRVTDVKLALEGFPVAASGRGDVVIEIDDAILPQNSRGYRLGARDGKLKVGADALRAGARPRLPRLKVGADMLGPLMAGTVSPVRAAEVGLVDSSGGAAEVIETWFRCRPAFLYQLNAF
jgi:hypothetical protein